MGVDRSKWDRAPWTWLKEESFWRAVTEQGLAGVVVALAVFLAGIAAGVIPGSFFWLLLVGVVGAGAILWGSIATGQKMGPRLRRLSRGRRLLEEALITIAVGVITIAYFVAVGHAWNAFVAETNWWISTTTSISARSRVARSAAR